MATNKSGLTYMDAFNKVKPILDQLKSDVQKAAKVVAAEYDRLPKLEKTKFAEKVQKEYGWTQQRLSHFAKIGRQFPAKAKLISMSAPTAKLEYLGSEHMREIVETPDELIKKAAQAGVFDKKVSTRALRALKTSGKLPTVIDSDPSDLEKIRTHMVHAQKHMDKASLEIGKITALMEDTGIVDAKGAEATALVKAFEKLCTKMASANPKTSERAFAILRGEV